MPFRIEPPSGAPAGLDPRSAARRRLQLAGLAGVGAAFALGAGIAACTQKPAPPSFKSTDVTGADYGRTLSMTDAATGKVRTLEDFRGKIVLVFFGFTQCPDICPTTLAKAAEVKKALGADGDKLQVLFISVDPERDSAEILAKYVPGFDPSFIGLRGDEAQTKQVTREFKVFYQKVPNRDGSSYTVDHTAASYIIDPQGRLRLFVRHTQPVDEIVADLKQLL
ncbi:MAG: SCO family protein [Lautropia sp.]